MKIGIRELTFLALLAAIPVAAALLVFMPRHKQVEAVDEEIATKQGRLAQLDRLGQTSASLSQELNELAKALAFFESKLPNDQQIHTVLREVTQIGEKYRLQTRSVQTQKQESTADYVAQPIELKLAGKFEGIYQFLYDLHQLPRITRIKRLEIEKDKSGEGLVQATLVILIYFEPNATTAQADAAMRLAMNAPVGGGGVR